MHFYILIILDSDSPYEYYHESKCFQWLSWRCSEPCAGYDGFDAYDHADALVESHAFMDEPAAIDSERRLVVAT